MFVLGIDPGLSRCGYGCVEANGRGGRAVAAGTIRTSPTDPTPRRLATLDHEVRVLLAELRPDAVAVERLFFQVNARTAMAVGQASGVVLAAAVHAGCEVAEYTPNEVKQAVAGYGAAPKEQVQRMVLRLTGLTPEGPLALDETDALALAVAGVHQSAQALLPARAF